MRALGLLCLVGCSHPLVVPLYEEEPVAARHPGLRGRVVPAEAYRPGEYRPPAMRWTAEDGTLSADSRIRFRADGIEEVYQVAPDGKVDFPYVGRRTVAGRTVSELRRELEDQLRAFLRNPAVVLEVQVPESDSDVVIVGMTNYEGVLRTRTETLAQALAYSNGLSRRANLGQIIVVRDDRAIVCDYYHYVEKDDARQNLAIRPGDLIVVTELYPPDAVPCAREWAAIESYFAGRLDRAALIRALDR